MPVNCRASKNSKDSLCDSEKKGAGIKIMTSESVKEKEDVH